MASDRFFRYLEDVVNMARKAQREKLASKERMYRQGLQSQSYLESKKQTGETQRTGMTQAGETERTGMRETGATKRQSLADQGILARQQLMNTGALQVAQEQGSSAERLQTIKNIMPRKLMPVSRKWEDVSGTERTTPGMFNPNTNQWSWAPEAQTPGAEPSGTPTPQTVLPEGGKKKKKSWRDYFSVGD
jgi:hypothetical protein